jgi:hypothetical protein
MSCQKVEELLQNISDSPAPHDDCSLPSPSRFKSLVRDLRQKLNEDVASPNCMDGTDAILQQTMDDVACLSRLLRISEACLVEERTSAQSARSTIKDLQHQLDKVSNESAAHCNLAFQLKSEVETSKERINELEHDVIALREALCKSEAYRKDYAKSKKTELLDMQSKLDAAAAKAASLDDAHQRTRALLLSEVEIRSNAVNSMQRLEASYAELQVQHQKLQDMCNYQDKQLQVSINLLTHSNKICSLMAASMFS